METWKVTCDTCEHMWTLAGNWSEYMRSEMESRPCPCCASYTLSSPEPKVYSGRARRLFHSPVCVPAGVRTA